MITDHIHVRRMKPVVIGGLDENKLGLTAVASYPGSPSEHRSSFFGSDRHPNDPLDFAAQGFDAYVSQGFQDGYPRAHDLFYSFDLSCLGNPDRRRQGPHYIWAILGCELEGHNGPDREACKYMLLFRVKLYLLELLVDITQPVRVESEAFRIFPFEGQAYHAIAASFKTFNKLILGCVIGAVSQTYEVDSYSARQAVCDLTHILISDFDSLLIKPQIEFSPQFFLEDFRQATFRERLMLTPARNGQSFISASILESSCDMVLVNSAVKSILNRSAKTRIDHRQSLSSWDVEQGDNSSGTRMRR
jgi:hypothetical protein